MMTLFCAVVGAAGSPFPVQIDAVDFVGGLKKAIKAEKPNDLQAIDADKLQLYLAKKSDGAWLESTTEDVKKLNEGEITALIEALTHKDKTLDATFVLDEVLEGMPTPGAKQIHVLVVLPRDEVGTKRRRTADGFEGSAAMPPPTERMASVPLPIAHKENYVSVSAALMDKCGLVPPRADNVLVYCRPRVRALWTFLREDVIAKNARAYIVGPPGTGKSLSTLCYLAQLDRSEWNVVWIHLTASDDSCLLMATGEYWMDIDLVKYDVPRVEGKKLVVCLDGYKNDDIHKALFKRIKRGLTKDDRLLVCSSMATMGKRNREDDEHNHVLRFYMYSWTLAEYEAAVADAVFYELVKAKLDATTDLSKVNVDDDEEEASEVVPMSDATPAPSTVSDEEKVSEAEKLKKKCALDRKFYYAGGSCRFMFQRTTKEVIATLTDAMEATKHKTRLIENDSGSVDPDTVNTLYGLAGETDGHFPVSSYVASIFADASSETTIAMLADRLNASRNPAIDGHLMEWLFLASVSKRVVKLIGPGTVRDKLPMAEVLRFDPKKRFAVLDGRLKADKKWLQPVAWNQGGYDAVYFDQDKGRVIFAQVTRSDTHSFKMRFFDEVLLKLRWAKMSVQTVDVYFVVKPEQYLEFKIGHVEDRSVLEKFDAKWTGPEEKQVKVRAFERNLRK